MRLGNLWSEFKTFAFKGNMIELAVAVVIGAAFSTVINSLVNDVIMPTVGYVVNTATTTAEKVKDAATTVTHKIAAEPATTESSTTRHAMASTAPSGTTPPVVVQPVVAQPVAGQPVAAEPGSPPVAPTGPATPAKPDDTKPTPVKINLMIGPVNVGAFIGALLNFLLVAAAVFLVIVKLLGSVVKKVSRTPAASAPTTKECPFCLSLIPIKATKCAQCTADLPAMT